MQIEPKSKVSKTTMRQLRMEMTNPQWQAGFTAADAKEPLDMGKGHDFAMGWLSYRLLDMKLLSPWVQ